ncbi:hypothetical protein PLICRDRAFT_157752 [Plicaturopsis crispa FD-325 SS-3]|nr:hypothetical protein PLICRDRAFT_157752 [Plicaturopsis crispa FD-325 SS-3]
MAEAASSRILTFSPSLDGAFRFIHRVKAHPETPDDPPTTTEMTVPWSIVNRYYTADVHFEAREVREWHPHLAQDVPAIVFVWVRGEPYKEHIQRLSNDLASHDPEVTLAVRLPLSDPSTLPKNEEEEDTIDDFLSTHGFEFVDVDHSGPDTSIVYPHTTLDHAGLPRVLDALSTIMWPTMVQSASTTNRKSRARELLDWAREEEEHDGLRALVDDGDHVASAAEAKRSRMQKEMDELERWLDEDEAARTGGDPWTMAASSGPPSDAQEGAAGFDDNFTVFVSAPSGSNSGRASPDGDAGMLAPMHTGASYASLGSDFDGEEGDSDLPSRAEIDAATQRIFGTQSPTSSTQTNLPASASATPTAFTFASADSSFALGDHSDGDRDDDDFDIGAFDLGRVLGALQGMKDEIAGISDERLRRRAAARVALGLVYGLEKEGGDLTDQESGKVVRRY